MLSGFRIRFLDSDADNPLSDILSISINDEKESANNLEQLAKGSQQEIRIPGYSSPLYALDSVDLEMLYSKNEENDKNEQEIIEVKADFI